MPRLGRRTIVAWLGVTIVVGLGIAIIGNFVYDLITGGSTTPTGLTISSVVGLGVIGGVILLMEGIHIQYIRWIDQQIQQFEDGLKTELENLFG